MAVEVVVMISREIRRQALDFGGDAEKTFGEVTADGGDWRVFLVDMQLDLYSVGQMYAGRQDHFAFRNFTDTGHDLIHSYKTKSRKQHVWQ
jgi:hypothetical protein